VPGIAFVLDCQRRGERIDVVLVATDPGLAAEAASVVLEL